MEQLPGMQKALFLSYLKPLIDIYEEKSSRQVDNVSSEEESDQEGDETGRLLRATVEELEKALEDTRSMLSERDAELNKLRNEFEQHRKQVTSIYRNNIGGAPRCVLIFWCTPPLKIIESFSQLGG